MLFAQREGFVSYSERDLHQIQQALNQAGIDYSIRQRDIRPHGGARMRWGGNQDAAIEYRILVDKKDEELARHVIGRCCVGKGTQQ